ncbi:hypothetical protein [Paenibacillus sp. 1781tsa1]|uniref:hypothetical protein n=1 Tax=Paenibacillus sp. 1781tsa1 TaxID=2953810 RepID=UPI00209EBF84|nr:hypothetical protein [Paenibacillus sp. 1781tsa1]
MNKEDRDQEIIDRSEAVAIQFLKDSYNLEVTITRRQLLPKMAIARVTIYGYVTGHKDQHFNVSVNYESNVAELLSFSKEFHNMLKIRGFDPYN